MFNIVRTIPPTAFRVVIPSRERTRTTRPRDTGWQGLGLTSRCCRNNWSGSATRRLFLIASRLRVDLRLPESASAAAVSAPHGSSRGHSERIASSMDFGRWRNHVIDAARRAADREYQQRVWFGLGPERDSPNELLCTFLDDPVFEDFLDHPMLPKAERAAVERLYRSVEAYASCTPAHLEASKVMDDPRFEKVRIAAREFLRV